MSQNGRREFLTSAAAVAAALAACTAPARRAQAQACATMYDEAGIVSKVAPLVHDTAFQNNLLTFPAENLQSNWNDLIKYSLVDDTWQTLKHHQITTVTVVKGTCVPLGTYDLIPSKIMPGSFKRWPVVLTVEQERTGSFNPDWSMILLFVIPHPRDYQGQRISTGDAKAAMCVHPFGM